MDRLDASDAREHIEMVERILAESSQRLCYGAEYFIVWGLYSAIATATIQLVHNRVVPVGALWLQAGLLLAAIAFTVLRARSKGASERRRSLAQREFFNVLWLTLALAFVANAGAFNLFSGWAASAIWSFSASIVLFFIGLHGNRRALIAGIAVVASMIVANFMPERTIGFVLALGMLAGYTGFGVAEWLAGDDR